MECMDSQWILTEQLRVEAEDTGKLPVLFLKEFKECFGTGDTERISFSKKNLNYTPKGDLDQFGCGSSIFNCQ